ncbi:hypothetical protein B0H13DRAFT_2237705 [Mycena leptocephala]|nr:hypothetical protein B0H13DRAFT_2237705 [Mycena leptocephala]
MLPHVLLALIAPLLALAGDDAQKLLGYSCDASKCKLPNCNCASTSPPGGLSPSDVPMFVVFTADDAVQSYTLDSDEINGNLIALNALAGIPLTSIRGFRAPFLNYSVNTLKRLAAVGFTYDSSAAASIPVTDPGTDAFWPYTLDNGMANDCLEVEGSCKGQPVLPGFWEIPMYAFFDNLGAAGPHLMDPWLDAPNGATKNNDTATLEYMKNTFTAHYNGNRQPIGLYTHPIHLSTTYPGVNPSNSTINMINEYLDWAQEQQNVWIVSNEQLLAWVRNPVPVSQLGSLDALKCSTPQNGLLSHCDFPDFPFFTCYGCPETEPTVNNPNPAQQIPDGQQARFRLPTNCSTAFWDPIAGKCLCTSSTCAFTDASRPIGPNGANLTGGGTGGAAGASASTTNPYVPFNGERYTLPAGVWAATLVGALGALVGTWGVFGCL